MPVNLIFGIIRYYYIFPIMTSELLKMSSLVHTCKRSFKSVSSFVQRGAEMQGPLLPITHSIATIYCSI